MSRALSVMTEDNMGPRTALAILNFLKRVYISFNDSKKANTPLVCPILPVSFVTCAGRIDSLYPDIHLFHLIVFRSPETTYVLPKKIKEKRAHCYVQCTT